MRLRNYEREMQEKERKKIGEKERENIGEKQRGEQLTESGAFARKGKGVSESKGGRALERKEWSNL